MSLERLTDEYLFQTNTIDELKRWCPALHFFHYLRARGGHNCEGDSFYVSFLYRDFEDLSKKLSEIGVTLNKIPEGSIPFNPMERYSLYDLDRLKNVIPTAKEWEQPEFATINGHKIALWVMPNNFTLSIAGNDQENMYQISEEDFTVAQAVEKIFSQLGWPAYLDNNIKQEVNCISRERYPEIFK